MVFLNILSQSYLDDRKYFIENGESASYFRWLSSKGTNFTCYQDYMSQLENDRERKINNRIELVRTIIYALQKPIQFSFFYWTILILIIYKFNFKNKIIKIIIFHFIFRSLGDMVDKFGGLMPHYFGNIEVVNSNNQTIYVCDYDSTAPERHPLKWVFTRQLGCILWYTGEIFADWYPLLRTREIVYKKTSIWYIFVTCGLFNISKIATIIYHFTLSPTELYDSNTGAFNQHRVKMFYFDYWIIQLIVIIASIIYDISIYYVLKKYSFQIKNSRYGFVKNFQHFSEYRICVTVIIGIIFLPLISVAIILKFYYYKKDKFYNLDFSFDETRTIITNLQYFIIYIDQVLLSYSKVNNNNNDINNNNNNNSINTNNNDDGMNSPGSSTLYENLSNESFYLNKNNNSITNLEQYNNNNNIYSRSSFVKNNSTTNLVSYNQNYMNYSNNNSTDNDYLNVSKDFRNMSLRMSGL
eukprot:jgi/Orpsp1_1/1190487/evm.model.d7180000079333.1